MDTLARTIKLEALGFERPKAEGLVQMVKESIDEEVAKKVDLRELRVDLKSDISEVRLELGQVKSELKQDIAEVRLEIGQVKSELKQDIADLRSELKQDIADVRLEIGQVKTELKQDIADVRLEIGQVKSELKQEISKIHKEIGDMKVDIKALDAMIDLSLEQQTKKLGKLIIVLFALGLDWGKGFHYLNLLFQKIQSFIP